MWSCVWVCKNLILNLFGTESAPVGDFLLLESSDFLLLESGDLFELE